MARPLTVPPSATGAAAPPDDVLVRRVQGGDVDAYDLLVRRYLDRAFAVAWRVVRDREDAQDLVQDAFLAALDHIATFDPTRPFGPWLFRIVANRGMNLSRSRRVRRAAVLADAVPSAAASPAEHAERAEVREHFARAVAALSSRQRLVIELVEVEGFTVGEVAATLGVRHVTVRWYLHRARQSLRRALARFADKESGL